jgi:hypothetical protein
MLIHRSGPTVEDVAVLQRSPVGNAVADHFIDRCAAGLRKVVIVKRGRITFPCCASLDRQKCTINMRL